MDHACWHCSLLELAKLGRSESVSLDASAAFLRDSGIINKKRNKTKTKRTLPPSFLPPSPSLPLPLFPPVHLQAAAD